MTATNPSPTTRRDPMRLLLIVGGVAVVAGFALIGLGWLGASRTRDVAEQIPYAISGGMFGLALIIAGSLAGLASFVGRMTAALGARGGVAVARTDTAPTPERYVATSAGTMYHRPTCPVATTSAELRPVPATAGMTPCGICEPGPLA